MSSNHTGFARTNEERTISFWDSITVCSILESVDTSAASIWDIDRSNISASKGIVSEITISLAWDISLRSASKTLSMGRISRSPLRSSCPKNTWLSGVKYLDALPVDENIHDSTRYSSHSRIILSQPKILVLTVWWTWVSASYGNLSAAKWNTIGGRSIAKILCSDFPFMLVFTTCVNRSEPSVLGVGRSFVVSDRVSRTSLQ